MKIRHAFLFLSMLLLLTAAAPRTEKPVPQQTSGWSFAGCFSPTRSLPCYDTYSHNGAYWICKECGTTKQPSENRCRPLSSYQLANGAWCS
ncbi:MAG TPA: hypothetical protein VEO54_30835 [Thermoanaerobaculia bacterium]|nr:hypothetical protein [Thermoanaerobaculia bacterium]